MKPLLCIRQQANVPLGIIEGVLNEEKVEWRYADCWTGADLDLSEISGLVVLGGTMNADEVSEHPHLVQVKEIMREAATTGRPLLGICLGVQLLSRSLGGEVYRAPVKETGFLEVEAVGKDPLLDPFAPRSRVFQFHEDTCTLPEGGELLYRSDDVAVQAFKASERAYGVQFHFEITPTEISNWCDATPDLETEWRTSKQELLLQADNHLEQQQRTGREVARRFIDLLG
ncbi:type 1 glutamine amidotransferase [soil metagenome]